MAPLDWKEFPQNFSYVENPYNGRLFLIGGGKFDPDTETLHQAWEIDLDDEERETRRRRPNKDPDSNGISKLLL